MIELLPDEFEAELSQLLAERANRMTVVEQALRPVTIEPVATPRPVRNPVVSMAAGLLLLVSLAAVANYSLSPGKATVVPDVTAVSVATRGELIVWMENDATDEEIAVVAERLKTSALVEAFSFVSRARAFAEFEEYFAKDSEVLAAVDPEDLPTSFRIEGSQLSDLRSELADLPGIERIDPGGDGSVSVETLLPAGRLESIVLVDEQVTDTQRDQIERVVAGLESTRSSYYISRENSLDRLAKHFTDYPELVTMIDAAELRDSFRVVTEDIAELREAVRNLPGVIVVDGVSVPKDPPALLLLPPSRTFGNVTVDYHFGPGLRNEDMGQGLTIAVSSEETNAVVSRLPHAPHFDSNPTLSERIGGRMFARDRQSPESLGMTVVAEPLPDGSWLEYSAPEENLETLILATTFLNGEIAIDPDSDVRITGRFDDLSGGQTAQIVFKSESVGEVALMTFAHGTWDRHELFGLYALASETQETIVRGKPGRAVTAGVGRPGEEWTRVGWYERPGQWVSVSGTMKLEELIAFAEELEEVDQKAWDDYVDANG